MENKSKKKEPSKLLNKQTHLHYQDKFLKSIPNLETYESLTVLYIHNNIINKIENLSKATGLTSLYLQNNKITKIENLNALSNLKKLYLNHNEISVVENLEGLSALEELYLEKQHLSKGEALCLDPRTILAISKSLQILNISNNNMSSIANLEPLKYLKIFKASHNNIMHIDDILSTIQHWYYLFDASFIGNPVAKKHRYRENIIGKTIRLEMLDDKQINETTRCFIKRFEREQQNRPRHSINLSDLYPGLPRNYAHPLQKAVSSSVIKTGLSAMNICTGATEKFIPWNALPNTHSRLKRKDAKRKPQSKSSSEEREILRIQV